MAQDPIEHELHEALRAESAAQAADVQRGTRKPDLAALLLDTYARGLAKAALLSGVRVEWRAELDRLLTDLDPKFVERARATQGHGAELADKPQACDIVLAEDSQDNRELLAALLEKRGYTVITAEDGPSAAQLAIAHKPRVLLVDIHLPGIDGYDVGRAVRNRLGGTVFIVAITGFGQTEDRTRALAAGFDHYLVKPVDLDVLVKLLSRIGLSPRR